MRSRRVTGILTLVPLSLLTACSVGAGGNGAPTAQPTGRPPTHTIPASAPASAGSSSSLAPTAQAASPLVAAGLPAGWVDDEVSFRADQTTIYATFRHPVKGSRATPATLLIAGSGPTDRNGNSRLVPGSMNTLANLANVLAAAGVATLRYDKVGSGQTGLGGFAERPSAIGVGDFTREARAAYGFMASRPGVDRTRLSVYGHSEGALFALLLATGSTGSQPPIHAIGLLEPLSRRYLDIITAQVLAQAAQQRSSGQITSAQADEVSKLLREAVAQLRAEGTVPANLPYGLNLLFAPSSLKFLREADAIDPARLGATLPSTMPVLVTCSNADIQVSCEDVRHLTNAITSSGLEFVELSGVDHVLKQDASRTAQNYGENLPFSTLLTAKLRQFVTR